jgi:dihydroorotase
MQFDAVIRGGVVVNSGGEAEADIGIRAGRIAAVGRLPAGSAPIDWDARGLHLLPGLIDTQVHFREPGLEHKEDIESGSRAALFGGVTAFLEMPNTDPATTTPEALADKLARADGRSHVDYGFFIGATAEYAEKLADYELLPGTPGVKIFMGSSTGSLLVADDENLSRVLRSGRGRCAVHAEDEARNRSRKALLSDAPHPREHPILRDAESARLATERLLRLASEANRPVHVLHISTADELPILSDAKRNGADVTCEVTPQHLWFTADDYERLGSLIQMNPPIRSAEHREALRKALAEGLFDVIGSDHAPHRLEEKARTYPESPSGMPGVQTLLPAMLTLAHHGLLDLPTLVRLTAENPAKLYGIVGKGRLEVGMDADIVLVDRHARWRLEGRHVKSKCSWNPYVDVEFTGKVVSAWHGGVPKLHEDEILSAPAGKMLTFRKPWNETTT